jgi:hypothetical protein
MNDEEIYKIEQEITSLLEQKAKTPALALNILLECVGCCIAVSEFAENNYSLLNVNIQRLTKIRDRAHEILKEKISKKSLDELKKGNEMENSSKSNKRSESDNRALD